MADRRLATFINELVLEPTEDTEQIASELKRELAGLHARYGFADAKAFVAAVRLAASGKRGRRRGRRGAAPKSVPSKSHKRAVITDATRAKVKKLVEAGKVGNAIAKAVGISLPSVHNVKKQLGLVGKKAE